MPETISRLKEKLTRECGPVFMNALHDQQVIEIMLNPDGFLWIDKIRSGMENTGHRIDKAVAESMLNTCASMLGTAITYDNPILEGEFPLDGSRLQGLINPIVIRPSYTIRKKASQIFTLDEYVAAGIISSVTTDSYEDNHTDQEHGSRAPRHLLSQAIQARKNILVVGGTGSGKTTLSNAILAEFGNLCADDRVITIEDTRELQLNIPNVVSLRTSDTCNMERLLRATMRLRPDRIVVGEVRGKEALSLLKAWNTGHPGGVATIHADNAYGGLIRLEQLIAETGSKPDPRIIAEAIDLIVFIKRINTAPGRLVTEIASVTGYSEQQRQYNLKSIFSISQKE